MLPNGDLTEVGERVSGSFVHCGGLLTLMSRGKAATPLKINIPLTAMYRISLSGGQKQRVNICRAIYCDTDIQIFDVCNQHLFRQPDIDQAV
jgi:ABC-type dipeptide/oligopeptide/nickel transport system ATPase subunit